MIEVAEIALCPRCQNQPRLKQVCLHNGSTRYRYVCCMPGPPIVMTSGTVADKTQGHHHEHVEPARGKFLAAEAWNAFVRNQPL